VGGFVLAVYLNPYKDGRVWFEGTRQQLGLPTCTFKEVTGLPCPACGMTSSFALLVRGDVVNSLRATAAGTVLAVLLLGVIPWRWAALLLTLLGFGVGCNPFTLAGYLLQSVVPQTIPPRCKLSKDKEVTVAIAVFNGYLEQRP